jgi:hypothetical protein
MRWTWRLRYLGQVRQYLNSLASGICYTAVVGLAAGWMLASLAVWAFAKFDGAEAMMSNKQVLGILAINHVSQALTLRSEIGDMLLATAGSDSRCARYAGKSAALIG